MVIRISLTNKKQFLCLVKNHPDKIRISSAGGAKDQQNKRLGVYNKMQNITKFELPVYKKTDGITSG